MKLWDNLRRGGLQSGRLVATVIVGVALCGVQIIQPANAKLLGKRKFDTLLEI